MNKYEYLWSILRSELSTPTDNDDTLEAVIRKTVLGLLVALEEEYDKQYSKEKKEEDEE